MRRVDVLEVMFLRVEKKLSARQIADRLGCDERTVYRLLPPALKRRRVSAAQRAEIDRLLLEGSWELKQIARRVGVSPTTVWDRWHGRRGRPGLKDRA